MNKLKQELAFHKTDIIVSIGLGIGCTILSFVGLKLYNKSVGKYVAEMDRNTEKLAQDIVDTYLETHPDLESVFTDAWYSYHENNKTFK